MKAIPLRPAPRGFSLIEILIGIAIIAVLALMLLAVSQSVSRSLQAAQCSANLRQLGQILFAYSADYDQALLPGIRYNSEFRNDGDPWYVELSDTGHLPTNTWVGLEKSIMRCPTRAKAGEAPPTTWFKSLNYGMSFFPGFINATAPDQPNPFKLSRISQPSRTALLAEVKDQYLMYPWENPHTAYPHDGSLNIFFADGHMEKFKGPVPAVIKSPSTAEQIIVDDPAPFF